MLRTALGVCLLVSAAGPAAGQTVNLGANFTSATFSGSVPPDTSGAVGPNHWMQYNNGRIRFHNKDGTVILTGGATQINETTFWTGTGNARVGLTLPMGVTNPSGDPRAVFDPLSNRFFVLCFTSGNDNEILIARSDTSSAVGTWKGAIFSPNSGTAGQFYDYPTLGIDRNGLYIGTNNFNGPFSSLVSSVPKASLLADTPTLTGQTSAVSGSGNSFAFGTTPYGVTNFNLGQAANADGRFIAEFNLNTLRATVVTNPGAGGATFGATSNVTTASVGAPPLAVQPNADGTAADPNTIDAGDTRLASAAVRVGNRIYLARGTNVGGSTSGRSAMQIIALNVNPTTGALSTAGEFTLSDNNYHYHYGSVAANERGDVVVGFTRTGFVASGSADNRYPSAGFVAGTFNGTSFSFGTPADFAQGVKVYTAFDGAPYRWGDYSVTQLDPTDPGIFWTSQEFANNREAGPIDDNYATQVAEIIPTVAGEVRWRTAANNTYATDANWFNNAVPGSTDHAIFSRNGDGSTNYTVTLPGGTTTANRASVRQGVITFSIPSGATYSLTNGSEATPSFAVADFLGTPAVTVSGGGTLSTVTTTVAARLNSEGTTANLGTLTVTGTGTTLSNSGNFFLGGSATAAGGTGQLRVESGATANVAGTLHVWNTASGVTVSGASTLRAGRLTNAAGSTPTVSLSTGTATLEITGATDSSFTGVISGSGAVVKNGAGAFVLGTTGAASTYTGGTTLNAGALRPGVANVLPDTGTVTFNGGTYGSNGVSEVLGPLDLAASSTLAFGGGSHSVQFANADLTPTGTLTVTGWTGTLGQTGSNGKLVFLLASADAATADTDFAAFRATVLFSGQSGLGEVRFIGSAGVYELVPVPEPGLLLLPAAGLLWVGRRFRR